MGQILGETWGPFFAWCRAVKMSTAKYVPESVLKKQKTQETLAAKSEAQRKANKIKRKQNRREIYKRAKNYAKEYHALERAEIAARRQAKDGGNFYVPAEAKVAVVIRIRGINGVDPKTRKILQLFRLLQIHNASFVRLNAATIKMLIYKRGFAKINGQRIPITTNDIIEQQLGRFG